MLDTLVIIFAAYVHQLESVLTEKIDDLTKFRGQLFPLFYKFCETLFVVY